MIGWYFIVQGLATAVLGIAELKTGFLARKTWDESLDSKYTEEEWIAIDRIFGLSALLIGSVQFYFAVKFVWQDYA